MFKLKSKMIIILILVLSSFSLRSQDADLEPCTPDCLSTPFGPVQTVMAHLQNSCWTKVYYTKRKACNVYQDLQILKMEIMPHYGKDHEHLQYYATMEQEFMTALEAILNNPNDLSQFDPKIDEIGCNTTWRITNKSCWATFTVTVINPSGGNNIVYTVHVPCNNSGCCMTQMEVCRDEHNFLTVRNLSDPQSVNCVGFVKVDPSGTPVPCLGNCNWVPVNATTLTKVPYIELPVGKESNEIDINAEHFGINVFNNKEQIHFQLYTKNINNVFIDLFDLNGKLIESVNTKINNGVNDYFWNNTLHNTVIMYQIRNGDTIYSTGKVLID